MHISRMYIEDFRLFHKKEIVLGKYITAISGFNATGKSTLLAILAQCGELTGAKYKPILYPSFRADLAQILKFSETKDKKIPNLGKLSFMDYPIDNPEYPSELSFRATIQKNSDGESIRYRIIPKKTDTRRNERKLTWPTLYIGLGRLFPVGESEGVTKLKTNLNEEERQFIIQQSKTILSLTEAIDDFTAMNIQETTKKKAFGFNTSTYDYLCNSAGQDNLGQILLALLSFRRVKSTLGEAWKGGLLLIDEIDATLHPAAQKRLVEVLYKEAKDLGLQIVFTTHSLSLLEMLSEKTLHNESSQVNNYELVYITTGNRSIQILHHPDFRTIYQDLNIQGNPTQFRKVVAFSEDEETRFVLKKLIPERDLRQIKLLDYSRGCKELLSLIKADYYSFSQYMYILDGDVTDRELDDCIGQQRDRNFVVRLPGDGLRPESLLWHYLMRLDGDHPFITALFDRTGYSLRVLEDTGPESARYNGKNDRERYKAWFNDYINIMDDLIESWMRDNESEVEQFRRKFRTAFNVVAKKHFIPMLC